MNSQGISVIDLRHTLPNLKYLILSLVSNQSSSSHQRKLTSHNYTITHTIASTSNILLEEEEEGEGSHSFSKSSSNKNTRKTSRGFKVGVT